MMKEIIIRPFFMMQTYHMHSYPNYSGKWHMCNLVREDIAVIQIWSFLAIWNDRRLILQVLHFNVSYQKETCHLERKNKRKSELPELQNCVPSCLKAQSSYSASALKCLILRNIFGVEVQANEWTSLPKTDGDIQSFL